jgi:D-alanyl-D-alanine-carboxypeptidase/D-alanyl-D-alanine-endopeptidase
MTREAFIANLNDDPLIFAPGTAITYSNFAFDLLGAALSAAAGKPFEDLVRERVLEPAGMHDTAYNLTPEQQAIAMQGHFIDGSALPYIPSGEMVQASGALQSTTNDLLRWLAWHLDETDEEGAEVRLLDHATYLQRDGLDAVFGMDESGRMDAMGLGWVVMNAGEEHPMILQKAGGMQGMLVYIAFAPAHDIGIFVAMNEYDFNASPALNQAANALIGELSRQ